MKPRTGWIEKHGAGWRLQIRIDGERIRRSFKTREEAQAALDELLATLEHDAREELARKLGPLTVADVVHMYYDRRKKDLELSTQLRYEQVLDKYVYPDIGSLPAKDLAATPILLADWLATLSRMNGRKALEVLNPAFRMAVDNGLIDSNPVTKISRPKRTDRKAKKDIPTPDEVEKILIEAYSTDVWWGYYVELCAVLGLRRSEAAALRWEDLTFPKPGEKFGVVHVRRAIGKKKGGKYIKAPKRGQARDILADRQLFEGLEWFEGQTGWIFPGKVVRREGDGIAPSSATGRLLILLDEEGGAIERKDGTAGSYARREIGTNSATFSEIARNLEQRGFITRRTNARRTFEIALTEAGKAEAQRLADTDEEIAPVHPDTMGHRFAKMVLDLGIRTEKGGLYSLHSLRHYRATHLYNATHDWVQVSKYLGHTSPIITMELYANNVVESTQADLAAAAARF